MPKTETIINGYVSGSQTLMGYG